MDFKTQKFIKRANKVHNNFYDYSKTKYIHSEQKVIIICPKHNEFSQKAYQHLQGFNCPKCGRENMANKLLKSNEQFINEANLKHNNFYDYSKVDYKNSKEKVIIICPKHGEFEQVANSHLNGSGCKKCGNLNQSKLLLKTQEQYLYVC